MPQQPVTERVEQDDGVRLHALLWEPAAAAPHPAPAGTLRPDVLLVHGLASNALLWSGVAERLQRRGHRVVAVDQRGHGRSEASEDLSWARVTADLLGVVQALRLERPIAIGQSWGGNVVVELALRHPDRIAGAVGVDGGAIELAERFPDWDACWAQLAPPRWDGVRWDDVAASVRQRTRGWPDGSTAAFLANLLRRPDGTTAAVLRRTHHRTILRHLWEQRVSGRWGDLTVPLLLVGALDGGAEEAAKLASLRRAAQRSPLVRVALIEPADHDVHLEQPDRLLDVVDAALADGFLAADPAAGAHGTRP